MKEEYEREMRKIFSDRLLDLSLRGSFSRGEAREGSDVDYFVLLDDVGERDLKEVARISKAHSVSPYLLDRDELERLSAAGRFQFFCENKELFGRLGIASPTTEEGWESIRMNFENALHATRHYLLETHTPSEVIHRLFYYIKTMDFSLRAYMLLKTNMYPGTRQALRGFVSDMPEAILILDIIDSWEEKRGEYEGDFEGFLLRLDGALRALQKWVLP